MSRGVLAAVLLWAALGLAGGVRPGSAHPLDPALLELRESADGVVEVLWRVPAAQPRDAPLEPVLPPRCRPLAPGSVSRGGGRVSVRWHMDCGGRSLVGERLGVEGLSARQTDALVRLHLADGRRIQAVLRGGEPSLTVPARSGPARIFGDYLALGFEHILSGLDHLLFILGLVLWIHGRGLLWTLTAFTAGHSLTLSLAALGFVRVPAAPVEVLIAASLFAVAVELSRRDAGSAAPKWRSPWAMAFAFGLLHGLGFAGALARVGLPAGEIPLALASFNSGIELGQIAFVGALLLAQAAVASLPVTWPRAMARIPAYAIGSLAAFWAFERLSALFGIPRAF